MVADLPHQTITQFPHFSSFLYTNSDKNPRMNTTLNNLRQTVEAILRCDLSEVVSPPDRTESEELTSAISGMLSLIE